MDNYRPDLLYSDGAVPFGNEVGLSQIANLYNLSAAAHGGTSEAVYTCKEPSGGRWVQDYERGVNAGINPYPWQTDTSIGDWFYSRHWKYQPLSWTVHMLVDIVSKNGNLLLNVVLRPDGSLDPEVETMLHQLAAWTAVNGKTLYAIALGWPEENKVLIRSLAATDDAAQNKIEKVELLGRAGELTFSQSTNGLAVELPGEKLSDVACALRITGVNLKPAPVSTSPALITPDARGRLNFGAEDASLHGDQLELEEQNGQPDIGFWDNASEWVSWNAHVDQPGAYLISATVAAAAGDAEFVVKAGGATIPCKVGRTAGWDRFSNTLFGTVQIKQAGDFTVSVRAKDAASWKAINLNSLRFTPGNR